MQTTLKSTAFKPSSPLRGDENYILRGQNMILEGNYPNVYYRAYKGSQQLEEVQTEAITGTIEFSPSSLTITGTGTSFLDELHLGQMIQAGNGEVIVVGKLLTQTTFVADRLPFTTSSNETATRLPVLGPLNINRFSLLRGNAVQFDKGTIIAVGDGELLVDGEPLDGDSLTASRTAQVAIYDATTQTYDVQNLGFDEVPIVTNADITVVTSPAGVKNMGPGYYSFKIAYYSDITSGYGNPTATLLYNDISGYQIVSANSQFEVDFSGDVSNRPAKATGYVIYGSAFSGSSDISAVNAIQGGWFECARVAFADLVGEIFDFEYIDSELAVLVSFDNDEPPDAEFVGTIENYLFLVSTDGQGVDSTGREESTSPGAFVSPAKPDNLDGYPAAYKIPTSAGETILGVVQAAGRFFVMTPNTLQAVTPTGLPSAPFTCRPFWRRGFINPYNLIFIDDTLYGYSGKKLFRSTGTADEAEESYIFAADVEAQLAESSGGYVFIAHDPKNECVCVFLSAIRQNDDGWWETDVYPYSLTKQQWQPKVVLTSTDKDMVVSGAATVNNELYFLAGGRSAPEPHPPLIGGIFTCGGECAADNQHAHLETDAGTPIVFDTNTVRSGKYSIKIPTRSSTSRVSMVGTDAQGCYVGRLYLRFESFPLTLDQYVIYSGLTGNPGGDMIAGLAFRPSTGKLYCASNWTEIGISNTYFTDVAGDGFTPSLNIWYRIDFKIDRINGTVDAIITKDGEASGTTLTQKTFNGGGTAVGVPALRIGSWINPTGGQGVWYYDDIVVSNSALNYPVGPGYINAFVPVSDGTHNVTAANQFERGTSGVDITNATTTAYQLITPWQPPSSVTTPGAHVDPDAYVEVNYGAAPDSATPTEPPRFVSTLGAGDENATNGNIYEGRMALVDNTTEVDIWYKNGSYAIPINWQSNYLANSPSGGPWTVDPGDGDFNALKLRMYTLSEPNFGSPLHHFYGAVLEAEFPGDEP